MHYSLACDGTSKKIKNTEYDGWIGCDPQKWASVIVEQSAEMQKIYGALGSSRIIDYQLEGKDHSCTVFANGAQLLVNTGSQNAVIKGVTVTAQSYAVVKGGVVVE